MLRKQNQILNVVRIHKAHQKNIFFVISYSYSYSFVMCYTSKLINDVFLSVLI